MPAVRSLLVTVFSALFVLSACTTIAPAVETVAPSAPSASVPAGASALPSASLAPVSAQPSVLVTLAPPTDAPPTVEPTATPEPTGTQPPKTDPPPASKPNLVITKLAVQDDPILIDTPAQLKATVKNTGSAAASSFKVSLLVNDGAQTGLIESVDIAGLAAGSSKQLSESFILSVASEYTLTASADPNDEVNEESESDNEKSINVKVKSLGNLKFVPNGFTVSPAATAGKYTFKFELTNDGTATLAGPLNVKFFAYTTAGEYVEWGSTATDINLAPGDTYSNDAEFSVDPNSYRAYAFADSGEVFQEIDETDNEAFYDFTAP